MVLRHVISLFSIVALGAVACSGEGGTFVNGGPQKAGVNDTKTAPNNADKVQPAGVPNDTQTAPNDTDKRASTDARALCERLCNLAFNAKCQIGDVPDITACIQVCTQEAILDDEAVECVSQTLDLLECVFGLGYCPFDEEQEDFVDDAVDACYSEVESFAECLDDGAVIPEDTGPNDPPPTSSGGDCTPDDYCAYCTDDCETCECEAEVIDLDPADFCSTEC